MGRVGRLSTGAVFCLGRVMLALQDGVTLALQGSGLSGFVGKS